MMNNTALLQEQNLFGLFELDATGTVLYSRTEPDGNTPKAGVNMTGRNFFEALATFENAAEFQHRIGDFTHNYSQADNFKFTCQFGNRSLPVKVLLARVSERSNGDHMKSILVHIRRA